jgi:hypothetical protein
MSSRDNRNPNSVDMSTVEAKISPKYEALAEVTQDNLEKLLWEAITEARKTAHSSEVADPKTMIAILATLGIQEVHSLGFVSIARFCPYASLTSRYRSLPLPFEPWPSSCVPRSLDRPRAA